MSPPRLSIAIPTLNRADLLVRAIDSALAQTAADIEILVSDNGSTDATAEVLARYNDPRLRKFSRSQTVSAARHGQFLTDQARGEFFLGLSDDDYLEPTFAAQVLAAFDRHPEAVFVYTGCMVHYESVQVPAVVGPDLESGLDLLFHHYAGQREISWCAFVTRTELLREFGPLPPDLVIGDMYFWTQMALRGPVACVRKVLSHYILLRPPAKNDNVSHGTSPTVWAAEQRALAERMLETLRLQGAEPAILQELDRRCRKHIARSAANQFIWTRIRGAGLADLLRWYWQCRHDLRASKDVAARLTAALLPAALLRKALLRAAARLAVARDVGPAGVAP